MGTNSFLKPDTEFAGYKIVGKLSQHHDGVRVEKARVFDPLGHAGFDPSGKIRLPP